MLYFLRRSVYYHLTHKYIANGLYLCYTRSILHIYLKGRYTVKNKDTATAIYWHNAGFAAFQLELNDYLDVLRFEEGHMLSKEALEIDILIIKIQPGVQILKNFANIFKTHNIVEYKPQGHSLSIWDYNRVFAYALYYSSSNKIALEHISVTFSVMAYPRKLIKALAAERGRNVIKKCEGIYHIEGELFPVQILIGKQLSENENIFLRNLRSGLSKDEFTATIDKFAGLKPIEKRDVYLDRLAQANPRIFAEVTDMSNKFKAIVLKVAKENGWFDEEHNAALRKIEEAAHRKVEVANHNAEEANRKAEALKAENERLRKQLAEALPG